MLDGQQRTISICRYIEGNIKLNGDTYFNLTDEEKEQILGYKLMIYICEGKTREKLDWFETINIAGEKLTAQEVRNAMRQGAWINDAKKYFSKNNCAAQAEASQYLSGKADRQDYLETALYWIADSLGIEGSKKEKVERYMKDHQRDKDCGELWQYFMRVITWVKFMFPTLRKKIMPKVEWGILYNKYKDMRLNPEETERRIEELMRDFDVTSKPGIYEYVFDGNEKRLHIRAFLERDKQTAYERQKGICAVCGKHFDIGDMEADHITPWSLGGKTTAENCQMLCKTCNRTKSNK